MTSPTTGPSNQWNLASLLLDKRYWMLHFLFVALVSASGLVYLTKATYTGAPPVAEMVTQSGEVVVSTESIHQGQALFLQRGLMNQGTFWGDGSERGPDFTADALRQMRLGMRDYYSQKLTAIPSGSAETEAIIEAKVKAEIRENRYDPLIHKIFLTPAQQYAFGKVAEHYSELFENPDYPEYLRIGQKFSEEEIRKLAAFFYWGAWATVANRPGEKYSYTHNWPYDPEVGNVPTTATYIWSLISIFILFVGIGLTLYVYGQMKVVFPEPFRNIGDQESHVLTTTDLESGRVRPTQRLTYRFFALAMLLFGLQILAGVLCATDFVRPFGIYLGDIIPFSVARSYHTLFQIFWFFMCWVGYTIFFLPRLSEVPRGQGSLIHLLFWLCIFVGVGSLVGIYLGQAGVVTGELGYWIGSQGWEFMEMGRLFQIVLLVAFALWIFIIYRAVKPMLTRKNLWSVPAWLLYGSGVMVFFLFFGLLVLPKTNFAIADFWRWMVVHMWVEVTFEVFTTVIVAYMMVQMNFISREMAERTIFLAVMMFLFTATIGIAHNFYWIAKPTGIIALGSAFSTTQVLPLLLLTLDAWQMRKRGEQALLLVEKKRQTVVMDEVWLYILAVNFWNVFGAGFFGSLINLPIVNYFEHATYLTNNHAHGAMFGVKGNVALGGMLFCMQHLLPEQAWNKKLLRTTFWCLNIGVAMMMFLDLFPVGVYQLYVALEHGFWFARSREIVEGSVFRVLTYLRSLGGTVFIFGGLLPLMWFVLSRGRTLQKESNLGPRALTTPKDWTEDRDE